ncbi:hypothetical protein [Streptomyces fumanus]|uniref:hypothetical protein n=1 Tax=Streptomyces fumanus TaxID=67302 RepID=UPI00167DF966|nr:hypothetical protein [Streptomyces fumanus]
MAAVLTALAGCSDDDGGSSTGKPAARVSATVEPPKAEETGATVSGSSAGAQSSPEEAVGTLITAVIEGDTEQACLVMGPSVTGSAPATGDPGAACASGSPASEQVKTVTDRLRTTFKPQQAGGHPAVEVNEVTAEGGKAKIPADRITVDGQTLEEVVLANSTGLGSGDLDIAFEATQTGDRWYVTDVDMNIG